MVNYKPIKIMINTLGLVKDILNMVIWYYDLNDLLVPDKSFFLSPSFNYCSVILLVLSKAF